MYKSEDHRWPLVSGLVLLWGMQFLSLPASAQGISIHERWNTVGSESTVLIAYIAGMVEAPDGSIWVSEGLGNDRLIFEISARGVPTRVVAGSGDGPGEVANPRRMAQRPGGGIAIYDASHIAVELFDASGEFERRVRLSERVTNQKGFAVLPSGDFVLSGGVRTNPYALHQFDPDGQLVAEWREIPDTKNPRAAVMTAGGPVVAVADGSILFSRAAPHEIVRYSDSGIKADVVATNPDLLEPIGDDFIHETGSGASLHRTFSWNFPQSRGIFKLPDGNVLNVVWFLDDGISLWQVYTPQGDLVASQRIARAYEPWALARNGDIIASYRDPTTGVHHAVRLTLEVR
ncbi:MAG TPA: hypothetical protein VFI91_03585 [Longimicrobiaceae bacterium]|nr:hypothetical protein [Longimicrobiaceae bacterium]